MMWRHGRMNEKSVMYLLEIVAIKKTGLHFSISYVRAGVTNVS